MSVNLGSAVGSIELKTDKVISGVRAAVAALRQLEAQTSGGGQGLEKIAQSGQQAGTAVAKGAQQAAQSLKQVADAGQQAGNAVASGTQRAAAGVQDLARSTQSAGAALGELSSQAGVVGGALAAGLGLAVKSAGDLQTAVARISTIAPEIDTSQVSRQLLQLSTQVGTSATDLAEAMNNIFSSIEVGQGGALQLTEQFAKGAIAASTSAETFGSAVLGVLNGYGLSVDKATHVSDLFFATLDKGVLSGDELARGLGQVTQSAKLAGVDIDTLTALVAGISREGGEASAAFTSLQNALNKVVTAETQQGLNDLGIVTKNANGSFRDIVAVLGDLDGKLKTLSAGDRTKALQDLFPDQEARTGVSILLNQLPTISGMLADTATNAGAAERAYAKMADTAQAAGNRLKQTLMATLIEAGEIALPGLEATAGQVQRALVAFNQLSPEVKNAAVYGVEAAAAILLLGAGAVKAVTGVQALASAVQTLQAASVGLGGLATLGPTLAGVAVIAGLVAIGMKGTNEALSGTAKVIDGELGEAIAKLKFSWQDMFFQGDADKLRQAVEDYAKGIDGTVPSVDQLGKDLGKVNAEIERLQGQTFRGFDDDQRLNQLRQLRKQLEDEIAALEKRKATIGPGGPTGASESDRQYEVQIKKNTEALNAEAEAERKRSAARQNATPAPVNPVTPYGIPESDLPTQVAASTNALNEQASAALGAQLALDAYQQALNQSGTANASAMQAIQGQIGPMVAALDAINQKRAQGLPITAAEAQLLQQIPGAVGAATNAYTELIVAQGRVALLDQQLASQTGQGSSAFAGYGGQIQALAGQFNQLTGAIAAAESQMSAIGQQNSKLSSDYNILGERITALQEKAKTKVGLNGDEQTELHQLLGIQQEIGNEMGNNASKLRELVVQRHEETKAALATAEAIKAAKAAQDIITQQDPFSFKEDRRVATGAALPPPENLFKPAPVQIPVELDKGSLAGIPGQIAGLDVPPVVVKVQADIQKTGAELGAKALAAFGGQSTITQSITVNLTDNATTPITNIRNAVALLGQTAATPTVSVTDLATDTIAAVKGKLGTLGESSATPTASVDDRASGPLGTIQQLVEDLDGRNISITATVNTGAALAAVQDLRDHMPSSPAKKGPFHVLPKWNVYDGLYEAGDDAVVSIQSTTALMSRALGSGLDLMNAEATKEAAELANTVSAAIKASTEALTGLRTFRPPDPSKFRALHDALGPILASFGADAAAGGDGIKAASDYAEQAAKIVGLVSTGADALTKLQNFKRPTDEAIRAFRDSSAYLIEVMVQVAAASDKDLTEAGATYAESAGKVYTSVGQGVEILTKLQEFQRPSDKAVRDFRDVSQFVINVLAQVARDAELDAVADAGLWAESAGKVFSSLASGVDALVKLQDFVRPTDQAVSSFRDVSQFLVNMIAQVAADGEGPAFEGAASWADSVGKIFAALSSGTDALTKLGDFERPTDQAVKSFRDVAQYLVNVVAQVGADSDRIAVAGAAAYAENVGKVLGLLGSGVDGLTKLGELAPPSDAAIRAFVGATDAVTRGIAAVAGTMDKDAVTSAATYADAAGKVLGLVGTGSQALNDLATGEFTYPDAARLAALAEATRLTVVAIAQASADINGKTLNDAARYAEGAGKVVSLVGNGVQGFAGLATFVAPGAAQIGQFKSAVSATVIAIAQAAKEIDKDAVKAAGEYADGAGKAVGLLGGAVSAFKSIGDKDFVLPSKEAIDGVVAVTRYGVDQLIGISGSYGKGQLAQLSSFADAAGAGYSAIGAALNASKALGDKDHVKPADALGQALSEFQAGLTPLGQLSIVAQQYATAGAQIGADIAGAYASIAGGLPGFNTQQATVAASVTVSGQPQVIIHRAEGAVDIRFLGENGQWIVSSLQADQAARDGVIGIVAAGIAPIFDGMRG